MTCADAKHGVRAGNEPAFKYSLSMVADRSPDAKHWTSVRLQNYTLYLETVGGRRFELSLEKHVPGVSVTYSFAECHKPRTTSKAAIQVACRTCSFALPHAATRCAARGVARHAPASHACKG